MEGNEHFIQFIDVHNLPVTEIHPPGVSFINEY